MSFAHGLPAVRAFRPDRRIALVCLLVAAVTSFVLGSSISRSGLPSSNADWLPFVGGMLPLLALCASAVGLFGSKPDQSTADAAEVETLIRQLNDTLSNQREEVARLQRSCDVATQDAAVASTRVSRAADASIDAETRLTSGIARWERKWEELATAMPYGGPSGLSEESLAARVAQRIEGAMPDFADIIRTRFSAFPDPSFHIAAGRLNATVEAVMVTFKGVIDDAVHKMASLNEISQSLRRDAVALNLAGREIATAGATVVARASDAISGVDSAIASLPAAVASMDVVASEMKANLEEATLAMRANRTALMTAGDQAALSAGRLLTAGSAIDEQREAVDSASERITSAVAEVIARIDAVQADRATLTELIGRLHEVSEALTNGTGVLTQAGQQAAGGVDATLAATGEMIEQIRGAIAPLPAATAELVAQVRTDVAGTVAAEISTRLTEQVDAAIGTLADAARITPELVAGVSADIAARVGSQIDAAIGSLTEAAQIAPDIVANVSADIVARVGGQIDAGIGSLTEASRIMPELVASVSADIAARVGSQIDAGIRSLTEASRITPELIANVSADIAARVGSHVDSAIGSLSAAAKITPDAIAGISADIVAQVGGQIDAALGSLTDAARITPDLVANVYADIAERLAARIEAAVGATQLPPDLALTLATSVAEQVAPRLDLAIEVFASAETTLGTLGRRTTEACEVALQSLTAAVEGLSAQSSATSLTSVLADAELEIRMAEMLAPLTAAAQSSAQALTGATDALTARTEEAMAQMPAALAVAGDALMARAAEALAEIPAATANLTSTADAAARAVTEAAAMLRGDSATLVATGRETAARLLQDAEVLRSAGNAVTDTDRAAIHGMIQEVDAVIGRLTTITATTDDAARELAGLKSIAATLESVTTTLVGQTGHLDTSSHRFTALGESVIGRLAENASQSEAAMRSLPAIAGEIGTVTANLRTVAETLSANAVTTPMDIDRLERLNQRFEATAASLPVSIEARVAAALPTNLPDAAARLEAIVPKLDRLDTIGSRLDTLAERLPTDLAAQVRDAIPASLSDMAIRLEAAAPQMEQVSTRLTSVADTLQQALPQTAVQIEAMTPKLNQLDTIGSRLETVADELCGRRYRKSHPNALRPDRS